MDDMVFGRRYRVTERIGSGGMADVYKAVDETLGRTVAVKVMHPHYASDPDYVARFRQEAAAAANLSHPSIVNIYDFGVEGETPYIVMELVRGTDLKTVVQQRGPIDPRKVAEYGAQVCAALAVAHGYGIVHRDIKPHNLVLTPDGHVKVMDFGIARAVDSDATQTGSVLGTAQYVSPEQAQGRPLGPESDLYSLGVCLYELSTGRLPFDGDTPVSVALKHVNDEPAPPSLFRPDMPRALEAVILRAMDKDPTRRYHSAEEMREALLRVANGASAPAATPRPDDTSVMPAVPVSANRSQAAAPRSRAGTNPWVWLGVFAVLLLAALGAAWASGLFSPGLHVPDTQGMTLAEAKAAITELGLQVGDLTYKPDETIAKGNVIGTDPPAGQVVTKDQQIAITLSSGPPLVSVPKVIGQTKESAIATLQAAGFVVDAVDVVEDFNPAPAGTVWDQSPAGDVKAPKGAKVKLWVSKGLEQAGVPYVVDKTKADAIDTLLKAGFKVKSVDKPSDTVAKGTVVDQKPPGGEAAAKGSVVTIYVSSGKPQVVVPLVTGLTQADAEAKLTALGLVPEVTPIPDPDPAKTGKVRDQLPAAGTKVDKGSNVTIGVYTLP